MFNDTEELRTQIRAFNLHRLEEQLVSLAKPSIRMTRSQSDDSAIPLGASKLGGYPDVPAAFEWPHWGERPLTFIGQFNFSEIAPHDVSDVLPKSGRLYFFFEAAEVPYGQYDERDGWRVLFVDDATIPLIRMPHPTLHFAHSMASDFLLTIKALPSHRLGFLSTVSLPTIYNSEMADFGIAFEKPDTSHDPSVSSTIPKVTTEYERYWQLYGVLPSQPRHFWLGHPDRIQYYVEWDVVTLSEQIEPEGKNEWGHNRYTGEQIAYIQSQMTQWQFLFQIDSDDSLDAIWGDMGTLYVCIPKASLAVRHFDECWTIMQCS